MTEIDRYPHWVRWSGEGGVYIGLCPDLFFGGVDGADPAAVLTHLREVMEEVAERFEERGLPLPPPSPWPRRRGDDAAA